MILIIITAVVVYILHPIVINYYIDQYNKKIDYSCNIDSDCQVKIIGTGICDTPKYRCVNQNSIEGKQEYNLVKDVCEAIEVEPDNCQCNNNICQSFSFDRLMD